jgi:hypothetical protein
VVANIDWTVAVHLRDEIMASSNRVPNHQVPWLPSIRHAQQADLKIGFPIANVRTPKLCRGAFSIT